MNAAEHKALPFSANQTGPGAKSAPGADAAHAGHTKKRPAANGCWPGKLYIFRCPLDGQRFTHCAASLKIFYISA